MSKDVHQLRVDCDTEEVPVGDLLRQGKGIAERLGDPALRWIRLEEGGYAFTNEVPGYRRISGEIYVQAGEQWIPAVWWNDGLRKEHSIAPLRSSIPFLQQEIAGIAQIAFPVSIELFAQYIVPPLAPNAKMFTTREEITAVLLAVRNRLRNWLDSIDAAAAAERMVRVESPEFPVSPIVTSETALPGKVFIVHGRKEATKEKVARYVRSLGLDEVCLVDEPASIQSLFDKLEEHARDATFAVILLTADDEGRLHGDSALLERRARQNVIFEWGFFMARLPRKNIAVLIEPPVTLPSDMEWSARIDIDINDGWQTKLATLIYDAGLIFDLKRVLRRR